MKRSKVTARKSTGGWAPNHVLNEPNAANAHKRAKTSPASACIPGLVKAAYRTGSWHGFDKSGLTLVESATADNGSASFMWEARGSSVYVVKAPGRVLGAAHGYAGLRAECSCPDGVRQKQASGGVIPSVCKHGNAALETVLDPKAVATHRAQLKAHLRNAEVAAAAAEQMRHQVQVEQDQELPGERDRIEHGLDQMKPEDVISQLRLFFYIPICIYSKTSYYMVSNDLSFFVGLVKWHGLMVLARKRICQSD